jgi:uncharacterized protein YaaR (DUF327 family)
MTSKEYKIWLEGFLSNTNLNNVDIRSDADPHYNYFTMIKTIHNKLQEVTDNTETNNNLTIEGLRPPPGPNPFKIKIEE